jgi:hypothetical protein
MFSRYSEFGSHLPDDATLSSARDGRNVARETEYKFTYPISGDSWKKLKHYFRWIDEVIVTAG